MPEAATLPTRKQETWRYADVDSLAGLDASALDAWDEVTVPAGETWRQALVLDAPGGTELRRLRLTLGEGARAEFFAVNAGGDYARIEVHATLARGAHFEFGGAVLGGGETTREFVTRVVHAEPEATSNQVVRAVQWGRSTGSFLGNIDVARHAQKTDAEQSFKGLLLEKGAAANAVPQLEIFADDVKCAHGATVGQLDEQARFYMAARGIPPLVVRRLLVQAFLGDAFVALEDEREREQLMHAALTALGDAV